MRPILVLAALLLGTACAAPTAPIPCTLARATSADTLGWSIRARGDTAGPVVAWTCDPRITLTRAGGTDGR